MKTFGMLIKEQRELKGFLLREVAAFVKIDQSIISKFEKGERKPSRDQVVRFANVFNTSEQELLIAWLSDKLVSVLENEEFAKEALSVAEIKMDFIQINR